ncbi:MAG: hypothetical protein JWL85_424 [Candidatus Saccharibacteria bacterium]|nr:hypothetical protein [Candidatus Saccharibacteria bacterium]
MSTKHTYRYDKSFRPKRHKFLFVFAGALLVVVSLAAFVWRDVTRNQAVNIEGQSRTVNQVFNDTIQRLTVDEQLYSMELPGDWKEIKRTNTSTENSITWQATKKGEDNRSLTLHIDTIPASRPLNRLLPVNAEGNTLMYGEISDNCASFTGGGSLDAQKAVHSKETEAKWQKVDFICNLPRVIDNEIGTGSTEGINTVSVTGPLQGKHKYFFVYTDRNVQPKTSILLDAIRSFRAK